MKIILLRSLKEKQMMKVSRPERFYSFIYSFIHLLFNIVIGGINVPALAIVSRDVLDLSRDQRQSNC